MAFTPAEQDRLDRLEVTLTRGLQTLLSRADLGEDSVVMPLVNRLRTAGVPMTDVRVKIQSTETPIERYQRELRVMRQWLELHSTMHSYKWDDFLAACSRKTDVTGAWKTAIATAIGENLVSLQYAEKSGHVPPEWLTKLSALPDWTPTAQRSNFAEIAGPLIRRLKHAGMSSNGTAEAFNDFLREFNGTHVTSADVRSTSDHPTNGDNHG